MSASPAAPAPTPAPSMRFLRATRSIRSTRTSASIAAPAKTVAPSARSLPSKAKAKAANLRGCNAPRKFFGRAWAVVPRRGGAGVSSAL